MDKYSFGYPKQCTKCAPFSEGKLNLVDPYFNEGSDTKVMLIGQDPTIYNRAKKVSCVLDLDQKNGQLSRWLREVFSARNFDLVTLYATNLVKCFFDEPPSTKRKGSLRFLKPYFENCRDYLADEILRFQPALVLTLGEPAHKLFVTTLDNPENIADTMQGAFTGIFPKVKFRGLEFDYSPCLHIKTFRVAQVYGDSVKKFKIGLEAYFR